jgi:hypothetical protein
MDATLYKLLCLFGELDSDGIVFISFLSIGGNICDFSPLFNDL